MNCLTISDYSASLAEKIRKGTGRTTYTANEHNEMGEIQGARAWETMESLSTYYLAKNRAILVDNSLEEKQVEETFQKIIQILKMQEETTDIHLKNLEAKINQMNESHNFQIEEMKQLHKNQISLYQVHGRTAIEGLVDEVNQLRDRVAQLESTVSAPHMENTELQEADENLRQIDTPDQYASDLLRCPNSKCSKLKFRGKANLSLHNREVHRTASDVLRCQNPKCFKLTFSNNGALVRHDREVHKTDGHRGYPCLSEQCPRATFESAFTRELVCWDHMRRVHGYTGSYDDFKSQARSKSPSD